MKKQKIITILALALLSSCANNISSEEIINSFSTVESVSVSLPDSIEPISQSEVTGWPADLTNQMLEVFGVVIPYFQLGKGAEYVIINDEFGQYFSATDTDLTILSSQIIKVFKGAYFEDYKVEDATTYLYKELDGAYLIVEISYYNDENEIKNEVYVYLQNKSTPQELHSYEDMLEVLMPGNGLQSYNWAEYKIQEYLDTTVQIPNPNLDDEGYTYVESEDDKGKYYAVYMRDNEKAYVELLRNSHWYIDESMLQSEGYYIAVDETHSLEAELSYYEITDGYLLEFTVHAYYGTVLDNWWPRELLKTYFGNDIQIPEYPSNDITYEDLYESVGMINIMFFSENESEETKTYIDILEHNNWSVFDDSDDEDNYHLAINKEKTIGIWFFVNDEGMFTIEISAYDQEYHQISSN